MFYCPACGSKLSELFVEGKLRPYCLACGYVDLESPRLAVAVMVEQDGHILMGLRGPKESAAGKWSFPAGFVDRGERVEAAAVREAREETGLEVRIDGLIGLYSSEGEPVVLAVYAATRIGGSLKAADDVTEVDFFPIDSLPEPAFSHDPQILADWVNWCLIARHRSVDSSCPSPNR